MHDSSTYPGIATRSRRGSWAAGTALTFILCVLAGYSVAERSAQSRSARSRGTPSSAFISSGTRILVALDSGISSATARVGDVWSGSVAEKVMEEYEDVIPPGSEVTGIVTRVTPGQPGSPAVLELAVRSIRIDGHEEAIPASAEPVIEGSLRATSLATGVGVEVYGDAAERAPGPTGGQVVLFDNTVMGFTVNQTVAMR